MPWKLQSYEIITFYQGSDLENKMQIHWKSISFKPKNIWGKMIFWNWIIYKTKTIVCILIP